MDLLKSPLYSKYFESNAKLVDFAGWEMPISFSGLIKEHESVRSSAGLFDISHMGVINIFKNFFLLIYTPFLKVRDFIQ